MEKIEKLEKLEQVLNHLKSAFIGKDEIIGLLGVSLIARENAFLLGPPGTAKSAIIRMLSTCIEGGKNFEYLLTRFTEPNEIFGPFDIRKLKEGELITNTDGMLPEASMVFLDEIFNANSAILNSLLMSLNERVFKRGKESRKLPVLMFIGASNALPEDDALQALLDRFLIRVKCDYVNPDYLSEVLVAGWNLEHKPSSGFPLIKPEEIIYLQQEAKKVILAPVMKEYINLIHNIRNAGIKISDRRAVKIQNLIAASCVMCRRKEAEISDLWVLKHVWDAEEQIELLSGIVGEVLEKEAPGNQAHPLAYNHNVPNAEELAKELKSLHLKWDDESTSIEERNIIKDKLRFLQNRASWVRTPEHKDYLNQEIQNLWGRILQAI